MIPLARVLTLHILPIVVLFAADAIPFLLRLLDFKMVFFHSGVLVAVGLFSDGDVLAGLYLEES